MDGCISFSLHSFCQEMWTPLYRSTRLSSNSIRFLYHIRGSSSPYFACQFLSTEKVSFCIVDNEGQRHSVFAPLGESLLDVAHDNDIELEGACGGELACSTCHLIFEKDVYDALPEISEEEEDMLDLAWGLTETSRLGCQIKVSKLLEGTTGSTVPR
uniref:2Fe2S ferredoxin putative n=1 Tax=Albugo laibachii Nc14 TaxID=890382 RepID=F0WCK6_9STRA|nr:2Fe2S ferredoxin putative [Albugo laibachii Nc14]|eukprot:CCA18923.1 2Fe2S ferredoxin putative [Albugo laibachii Nc14]